MDLDADLAAEIVRRVREAEPSVVAVLVTGSYARREADRYSDVDVVAVTRDEPACPFSAWFLERGDGRLAHVSVAAESLETWTDEEDEPAGWAFGFPVLEAAVYLWATSEAVAVLGEDPSARLPPGEPELEDFVEFFMKLRRAVASGDAVLLRWTARMLVEYAAGLLRPLNPEVVVRSPPEALRAALTLPVAPEGFHADARVCLGLDPASAEEVAAAGTRLARGLVRFLEPREGDLGLADRSVADALREGVLRRYMDA
ncbi:MAG: nucleotidyltransferase domain-containing protein [Phenylobacterium sp.]|uniref:nucleotidyltransferase domain-containing protein n=1 Tax=Phenylobacterium sp. TaxID=1871053 RepID=UPI001A5DA30E|nr:nucleotidyltransferase domain-containing protein [Phenylobacterium sp.]MBL8769744.1 nucleotidyltransferase domain-containing protein [Phenylobacterium sp.]